MSGKFEESLAKSQADMEDALRSVQSAANALKRIRKSMQTGDIKALPKQMDAADQALGRVHEAFQKAREGWDFDEETYFNSGLFFQEILESARTAGVDLFEMDGRLFCYPSILKLMPADRVVFIDKKREKRLRPSFFLKLLHTHQNKPVRFKPEAFLESIYSAYVIITERKRLKSDGPDIPLLDIYKILTLLPGQSREYSRQEFARDIYLLDQSHVTATRDQLKAAFRGSSGTRNPARCLRIVTREGHEKLYYSISFSRQT
ncbi:hypothetical protein JXA40_11755 [bacterium]|nr:hypothetical protein [candidate division CSSED10-310 bacterium]